MTHEAPKSQVMIDLHRLRQVDLNLLLVLRTLLETASVSETARRLGSTQPSVSRVLERLRRELGDPLLVKSSNTLLRTARAQELRPLLDSLVELLQGVYRANDAYNLKEEQRTCTIGANDSLQAMYAAPLIAALHELAPHAQLRFKPVPYPNPTTALVSGDIDLLLAMSNVDDSTYRNQVLFQSGFSCLCSADNAAIGTTASIEQLAALPYLDVSHMGQISAVTEAMFAAVGRQRHAVARMSSFLAAPAVIAGSAMVCLVPDYLGSTLCHHPGVRLVPLAGATRQHAIRMIWHNATHFDAFMGTVRSLLLDISTSRLQVLAPLA